MTWYEALVLGLLQGLTEFIPVSSSGHLLLAHDLFGSDGNTLRFDVALHAGTLGALLVYFRSDILSLARNAFSSSSDGRLARLLIAATIPAAAAGVLFADFIEQELRSPLVVAVSLAVVGALMLYADKLSNHNSAESEEVSNSQGLKIGLAQALALIPGVSRSGITITSGIMLGLSRVQAARFSFLLAVPIITGSMLSFFLDESLSEPVISNAQFMIGVTAAFVSGLAAIKILLNVVARIGLTPFAYYRIALSVVVMVFLVI